MGSSCSGTRFLQLHSYAVAISVKVMEADIFECVAGDRHMDSTRSAGSFLAFCQVRNFRMTNNDCVVNSRTIFTIWALSSKYFKSCKVMIHMSLVLKPDVGSTDNFKSSLVVPCCERSQSCLSPLTITVTLADISSMRIISSMVTLSKDPKAIPTH